MPEGNGVPKGMSAGARAGGNLSDRGIHLRHHRLGEHRTACPQCAASKHRRGDTALAVRIDADGTACWTCHRCGWRGALNQRHDRTDWQPARPSARPSPPDPKIEKNRLLAQELWRQSGSIPDGLPFDYLTKRRGITVWDPDRLRWHPACPWQGGTAGCLVAPVNDHATGMVTGIWRIRCTLEGKVERRGLGPTKGNAARLFWAEGPELVVTEGVEDALAAHALTGLPAWAALSAGNMGALVVPARFTDVLILADADAVGIGHAAVLARRLKSEGRAVRLQRPRWVKDANELLLNRRAG
jgi:putative DNA primase/helicase